MPTVAELMADSADMDVICDLGQIRVTYRPRVLTPQWQKDVGDRESAGGEIEEILFQPLRQVVSGWDLDKSPGVPYELTDEDLHQIPRQILNQVLWSLMAATRPNQQKPPVLSPGSSPAPTILRAPTKTTGSRSSSQTG